MERILFVDDPKNFHSDNAFVAHIPLVKGKEELLETFYHRLLFPSYFGFNWDSLSDCLNDFHWISHKQILIVHEEIPALELSALNIYMTILLDAVQAWQKGEEHLLQIVFPTKQEEVIKSYYQQRT